MLPQRQPWHSGSSDDLTSIADIRNGKRNFSRSMERIRKSFGSAGLYAKFRRSTKRITKRYKKEKTDDYK